MKPDSSIKNFTRGGQTLLHNFRMINQIMNRVIIFCFIVFLMMTVLLTYYFSTDYRLYLVWQLLVSKCLYFFDENSRLVFINPNGNTVSVLCKQIINAPFIETATKDVSRAILKSVLLSCIISIGGFLLIYGFLKKRGAAQSESIKLRGDEIADWQTVKNQIIKSGKVSDIHIAGLPMPKDFETRHILIHGTTGSGKSVCIRELLDQIRARGDRAIIYDKGCDYIRRYYREGIDVILNPMDERTVPWHLWNECRDAADYDSLAAALMPMTTGNNDPFWISAARTIFSAAARQMESNPKRSAPLLLKALLTADLATMGKFLKGTEAETLVSEKIEKTAISIKSVLTTYLKSLSYVKDERDSFSIRKWIQDDCEHNWLFVSSMSDKHETLKPLISMWLDIAANALMSLTPSDTRRIWMIFDELPSLQRLPYLPGAFAEARKFGGCLIAGMQSISQLRKEYGNHAAEEISNLCNTRIFFRDPSFETAQWASRELGENETEEVRENISYSESAMRSGISLSNQRYQKQLISSSEIMHLNDLEAFVRLPGHYPLFKIRLRFAENTFS